MRPGAAARGVTSTSSGAKSDVEWGAVMAERDRVAEFQEVLDLMPDDPVVRFGLAGAYLEAGQPERAAAEYREAIRLKPDYSAAYRGLGRSLERAGRLDEAKAAYARGVEIATQKGDLQTKKEIEVFLRRLETHTR
jgi:predicted Zn-dependent protease